MSKSPCISFAKEHLMQIIFQEQIKAVQSKKKRKKETLLITDQAFLLDDGTEFNYYYWVKVSSLEVNGKEIAIQYDVDRKENNITVLLLPVKTDIKQILSIIIDLLQRILIPKKFQKVNKSKYYAESPPITGHSIMSRFFGYYDPNNLIEIENSNIFRLKIMTRNPILRMENFKSYQALTPSIFNAMSFINFIDYLDFGENDSIINDLIKNFEITKKISCISFGSKDKSKLSELLKKISEESNIEGISISSLSLSSDESQNFINTLKNKKMSSIGFHEDSLSSKGLTNFLNDANSIPNLIYLNFNGYANLDLDSLSSKISFITILSLAKCDLDIQKAIKAIFQNDFSKLSELDLSSNRCNSTFNVKQNFPPKLSKLVVGDINWKKSSNLISFLSFVFKKMNSILKLNVYSASFDESDEWKNFFNKLTQLDINLSSIDSFGWDNNPIDSGLFSFIEKCINLKTLSISSFSIIKNSEKQLDSLVKYFQNSKSKKINTLILSSDDSVKSKFKDRISDILSSLTKWKSLKTLDISQNMISDDGIGCLQNFLTKNPIKLIILDRSSPSSIKTLVDFFNAAPKGSKVNFPFDDVNAFLNAKKSNLEDLKNLIQLSSKMLDDENINVINLKTDLIPNQQPKGKTLLQKPESSPLDEPFFVFSDHKYKSDLFIPEYIKSSNYQPLEVKPKKVTKNSQDKADEEDKTKKKKKESKKSPKKESDADDETYSDSDEEYDYNPKKKKKHTSRKGKIKDDSYVDDYDDKPYKKKNKKRRRKEEYYSESDDENTKKNEKKKTKQKMKHSTVISSSDYSENDDFDYNSKKKTKKEISRYEMYTISPQLSKIKRKSPPKSLMGNTNKNHKTKSLYEMKTKSSPKSHMGNTNKNNKTKSLYEMKTKSVHQDKNDKKRKKMNKYDKIDEDDYSLDLYSDSEFDEEQKRSKRRNPPKIINIESSSDEDFSENSFEKGMKMIKERPSRNRVNQRAPPPLDNSDDDNDYDFNRKYNSKHKSKISLGNNRYDDEDDNDITPKPPNWSFPLQPVPSPYDSKQIIDELNENYSVSHLLKYMYQS